MKRSAYLVVLVFCGACAMAPVSRGPTVPAGRSGSVDTEMMRQFRETLSRLDAPPQPPLEREFNDRHTWRDWQDVTTPQALR